MARTPPPQPVRVHLARAAAHLRFAGMTAEERRAATAPAREGYARRWHRQAAEKWPHLDGADLDRAADSLRRAHLAQMAARAAAQRASQAAQRASQAATEVATVGQTVSGAEKAAQA